MIPYMYTLQNDRHNKPSQPPRANVFLMCQLLSKFLPELKYPRRQKGAGRDCELPLK